MTLLGSFALVIGVFIVGVVAGLVVGPYLAERTEADDNDAWWYADQLRQPEGASVTIMCDNPDFNEQPNSAIEVCDDWTGWVNRRFTGDTAFEALKAAYAARDLHGGYDS